VGGGKDSDEVTSGSPSSAAADIEPFVEAICGAGGWREQASTSRIFLFKEKNVLFNNEVVLATRSGCFCIQDVD